jgi:hypothetical protein
MNYYIINKKRIKASNISAALRRYGKIVEQERGEPRIGLDYVVMVLRLGEEEYKRRGGT